MDSISTEAILESISDGVFTVDHDWRITSFNRAAEQITGIPREQAIGLFCSEVFKSSMCERQCPLAKTFETGKAVIDQGGFIVDLKGNKVPVSVSTALLKDSNGNVIGGAETFRDLSEIEQLKKLRARTRFGAIGSNSPAMRSVIDMLPAISKSSGTILITGETGTGKEVLARTIHQESPRKNGPFVAVNCAALPEALLESELFGYRKGAFTGADKDKAGRFALAQNGTLFLDEIADISLAMQVKLLRVLQEQEYEPLGATKSLKSNARILCATHRNLEQMVSIGTFRQDLYYRIHVIELHIPPLRERLEDLPLLAQEFLDQFNVLENRRISSIDSAVFEAFYAYDWPGNIRELENAIERAVVLCRGTSITLSDIPKEIAQDTGLSAQRNVEPSRASHSPTFTAQRDVLLEVLERNDYHIATSANELGMHRATLYRQLKRYHITLP